MKRSTQVYNFAALLIIFSVLLWMLFTDRRVTRKEGLTLLLLYVFYISGLVLLSAALKA